MRAKLARLISGLFLRAVLTVIVGIVTLFLIVQAGFVAGWFWLQGSHGQQWLNTQVETALEGTGYHMAFDSIGYRPFSTVVAKGVKVTDDKGVLVVAVDRAALRTGFASLMHHQLRLTADVGTVTLGSGVATSTAEPTPDTPIVIPDIYIKSIILEKFTLRKLVDEAKPNDVLLSELKAQGEVTLGTVVDMSLNAELGTGNPDYYPKTMTVTGSLDPQTLLAGIEEIKINADAYQVAAAGSLNLGQSGGISIVVNGSLPDLSKLSAGTEGSGTLTADITGTTAKPEMKSTLTLALKGAAYSDIKNPVITVTGTNLIDAPHLVVKAVSAYMGKPVSLSATVDSKGDTVTLKDITGKAPGLTLGGNVTADTTKASATGKMKLTIRDLTSYAPDVAPDRLPQGTADIIFAPTANQGYGFKINSGLRIGQSRVTVAGHAGIDPNFKTLTFDKVQVRDGGQGTIAINGTYGLSDGNAKLRALVTQFAIPAIDEVHGRVSADLTLTQTGDNYFLEGTIRPNQIDVAIPERMSSSIPQLNVVRRGKVAMKAPDALEAITVKIALIAKNRIFVRGWGLDAELGGNVDISGKLNDPQLNGQFSTLKGRYEEFGKRFTIDHAIMRFQGSVPPSPYLDIKAVTQADDIEAAILLTGPASKPEIGFSSVPALPKDEVLARILFGRDVRGLSPFEAVQLADTLRRLSGEGSNSSFNPLQSFRNAVGLDDLRVDQDSNGETTVGAGKYISDKVYVEVKKGQGSSTGGANIQIDLSKSMKLESEVGQESSGAGLSWRWDY